MGLLATGAETDTTAGWNSRARGGSDETAGLEGGGATAGLEELGLLTAGARLCVGRSGVLVTVGAALIGVADTGGGRIGGGGGGGGGGFGIGAEMYAGMGKDSAAGNMAGAGIFCAVAACSPGMERFFAGVCDATHSEICFFASSGSDSKRTPALFFEGLFQTIQAADSMK